MPAGAARIRSPNGAQAESGAAVPRRVPFPDAVTLLRGYASGEAITPPAPPPAGSRYAAK